MIIKAIVASACLSIFSAASTLAVANATNISNLTDLSKEIGSTSAELAMTSEMDSDCKAHFKQFEKLRSSNIVFSINKDTIESYPAWPLVCSYAVTSDRVEVHDIGRGDRLIEFVRGEGAPYLSIVLQQVTDDEQEGADYQMISMNDQQTMQYARQKLVMDTMVNYYHHVVGN